MPIALLTGLFLGVAPWFVPPPDGLSPHAWHAAGIMLMMAAWWLTEAIPLAATALVPLAVLPLTGALPFTEVASAYSHPLIMLFLGGFLIARAIEKQCRR